MGRVGRAFVVVLLLAVVVSGCGGSKPTAEASSGAGQQADSQVFSDVVGSVMPLPTGASLARVRRINNFTLNLDFVDCGATPRPLDYVDSTAGQVYPDVDMIRERGLPPIYDPVKYYHLNQAYGAAQSAACAAAETECASIKDTLSKQFKECAAKQERDIERLHPRGSSPSFLGSVNVAYFRMKDPAGDDTMWKWSGLFARCTQSYYAAVTKQLKKRRPKLVEKNREVLEAYAAQLVKYGYVP